MHDCSARLRPLLLHQRSDGAHLGAVILVGFELRDLGGENLAIAKAGGGCQQRSADGS
jgi:hypothetical protein